jgi:hypothetical protein
LQALAESGEFDETELRFHRERMRQFNETLAMGGDVFVDAVHAAVYGAGKPPKLRKPRGGKTGKEGGKQKPVWLRFLRGSRKETVET